MPKPHPVLVVWNDSHHVAPGTWVDLPEELELGVEVTTVGWLLDRDRAGHVLVAHTLQPGGATGVFAIPLSCVKTISRLR